MEISKNKQPSLAVAIISFNEQDQLPKLLSSIQEIADEIWVMDSFSTDQTVEIAKSAGAKVISRKFTDYSDQKNSLYQNIKTDFILSLDADEFLSTELIEEIKKEKEKGFLYDTYSFPRLTNYYGKWLKKGGAYPERAIRLWKNSSAYWEGEIHEKLKIKENSRLFYFQSPILHNSFPTLADHIQTCNRYSSISAQLLFEKGKKYPWYFAFLNAKFTFIKKYFLKGGCLEGFHGFLACYLAALSNFLKYTKLYFLHQNEKKHQ